MQISALRGSIQINLPHTSIMVDITYSADSIQKRIDQLSSLASRCSDPNPFYDPHLLIAALQHIVADRRHLFVLIYAPKDDDCVKSSLELIGFFPFSIEESVIYKFIPTISSFTHKYCFVHTPLLDDRHIDASMDALFYLISNRKLPFPITKFSKLHVGGEFAQRLYRRVKFHKLNYILSGYGTQPVLLQDSTIEPGKKRKKALRHSLNKLSKWHDVELHLDAREYNFKEIADNFLVCEHGGWKGRNKSSIASNPNDVKFFRKIITHLHKEDKLSVDYLTADGRTIAVNLDFCSSQAHNVCFAFKTAYEEKFKKFSPGVLLLYHKSKHFIERKTGGYFDSCAPNNSAVEELWTDRNEFVSLIIGPKTFLIQALMIFHKLKQKVNQIITRLDKRA